jgi:predicted site-specific integrase-resolvase
MPEGYITLTEAGEILHVSRTKIARMVREGVLQTVSDPLDARVKLVKKEDVERIAQMSRRGREGDSPKHEPVAA